MSPKHNIAHYRLVAKLGEGGMGEVWRARDAKLGRDVAIKFLPDAFAGDVDRMARFQREAQILASLNHPNIAAIYGVEDRALVMELVEGNAPTGPLPGDQMLAIIDQLVDALEYAHERGIVHRDLKPSNLRITPDFRIKVLDFGLAKACSADWKEPPGAEDSPTITMNETMAGVVLGTPAYMAPEQAGGMAVDKRADIWSFGVALRDPALRFVFFFEGNNRSPTDRPEHFQHANSAYATAGVWIADGEDSPLVCLLKGAGCEVSSKKVFAPTERTARTVQVQNGLVVFLPKPSQVIPGRPIVGVVFLIRDVAALERCLNAAHIPSAGHVEAADHRSVLIGPKQTLGLWLEFRELR